MITVARYPKPTPTISISTDTFIINKGLGGTPAKISTARENCHTFNFKFWLLAEWLINL